MTYDWYDEEEEDFLEYVGWFDKTKVQTNSGSSLKEAQTTMDTITVKVGKIGAATREYLLAEGATVQDLLTAANKDGVETAGFQIRIDGETAQNATQLSDGDLVQLLHAPKGG